METGALELKIGKNDQSKEMCGKKRIVMSRCLTNYM
jgi:hypothetical protein